MVRKLALAVSLALGTLSVPVHALGLGELSSKSTLNQNFSGDITLLSVKPEELDAVRVKLADSQAFARAGVERPFYLSLLKFEPTLSSQGKSVIRVSSEFPIREPFLNFLIEVDWPNGRLLREYTVLLDPPTTTRRRPPKVASATKARSASPDKTSAAPVQAKAASAKPATATGTASAVSSDGSEYGPVVANDTAWSIAKKVRPRGVSMEQMMMALLDANPQAFIDGNINRLRKGQILRVPALSEIQQVSRQQAREAYREQQDRWLARRDEKLQESVAESESAGGSVSDGAAGAADTNDQLRIATARPEGEGEAGAGDDNAVATEASDIKSRLIVARENAETSRQEAETLRSQVDDLQVRLENMQKLLSLKDDQLAQLQDRVVTEELVAGEAVAESPAEATPEQGEVVVSETAVATLDDYRIQDIPPQIDPDRIVEAGGVDAVVAEETAIESTVAEPGVVEGGIVEGSGIQDIPKQVDPDLIVLGTMAQTGVDEVVVTQVTEIVDAAVVGDGAVEEIIVTEAASADEIVVGMEPVIEPEPAVVPVEEAAVVQGAEPPVAGMQASETVVVESAPVLEATNTVAVEPQEPVAPSGLEAFLPKPMASMIEKNMVPFAAGGVLLLGLFGWLFTRGGRKRDGSETLKPAVATAAAGAAQPSSVDEPALNPDSLEDLPDSAFLDEFSPSDINTLQDETGEVDPVSEADVYIAYGRYQQAEEMLRQAMNRDPDRLALKHKLLEVHYATRNAGEFSALAQEMVDAGQDSADDAAWARAQDMGRELAPENPLFASKEGDEGIDLVAAAGAAAAAAAIDDDTLALDDLELSELTAEFDEEKSPAEDLEAPSEVSIMLDLDEPSGLTESKEPELPEPIQLNDISALDFELPEVEMGGKSDDSEEDDDLNSDSLNLDSMMAQAEAAVDADDSTLSLDSEFSADELQAQLDELSDLSILDSELDQPTESAAVEPSARLGLVEEDTGSPTGEEGLDQPLNLDTAFDADEGDDEAAEVIELEEVAVTEEPVSEDEVATKLDLARAYVEMGDDDGARSILEEVVAEGNQSQRGDAETLLGQLG